MGITNETYLNYLVTQSNSFEYIKTFEYLNTSEIVEYICEHLNLK